MKNEYNRSNYKRDESSFVLYSGLIHPLYKEKEINEKNIHYIKANKGAEDDMSIFCFLLF